MSSLSKIHWLWIVAAWATLSACAPEPTLFAPVASCEQVQWPSRGEPRSVILVLNDTMRRDAAGIYGGRASTPRFDRFAQSATLFEQATTQAPWTKPSMATLFTSVYPSQHGMLTHPGPQLVAGQEVRTISESDVLSEEFATLAEVFASHDYQTGAFVSNPWLDRRFGLAQGFDVYDDSFARFSASGTTVNQAALAWLETIDPQRPFFLYVHYVDTHRPHPDLSWDDLMERSAEIIDDQRPLSDKARSEIATQVRFDESAGRRRWPPSRALMELAYEKGVEVFDVVFGDLLDGLDTHPVAHNAMIVVTSDHGEALYERGFGSHGHSLFQEEATVPLVVKVPQAEPGTVDCPVGLVDVMPTLCDYLGMSCPDAAQGRSFLMGRGDDSRYIVGEGVTFHPDHRSISNGRFKLIYEPHGKPQDDGGPGVWSLYDLVDDPLETNNLLDSDAVEPPPQVEEMARRLRDAVAPFDGPATGTAPVDEELRRRLETLGYVGDTSSE